MNLIKPENLDATLQAMVDVVVEDEHGFESIINVDTAKIVLERAASRLPTPAALLERIRHAQYPDDLMLHLREIIGQSVEDWEPYVKVLLADADSWDNDLLETFATQYWLVRVRDRIYRGDFARAWDELRKAYQGFDPEPPAPFEMIKAGEPSKLTAPITCIVVLLQGLHYAMAKQGLVPEVSLEPVHFNDLVGSEYKLAPDNWDRRRKLFPGEVFVRMNMDRNRVFVHGHMAYVMAKYFASLRNEKRKRKTAKAMSK